MKSVDWTTQSTKVDELVTNYLGKTLGRGHIHKKDIQELISESRKAMDVDGLYMVEENLDAEAFVVTYGDFKRGVPNLIGLRKEDLSQKGRDAKSKFNADGLFGFCKTIEGKKAHVLSYGIFQEDVYEGSLNLIRYDIPTYEWTEEEQYHLVKIGRVFHQKIAMTHDRKMRQKLEGALKGERHQMAGMKRYMAALSYFSTGHLEANVTKDVISNNMLEYYSGSEWMEKAAQFKTVTELTEHYSVFLDEEDQKHFFDFMNRERLMKACEDGDTVQIFRFKSLAGKQNETWFEILILLSKDESTGDIMAIQFLRDVTTEVNNGIILKEALSDAQKGEEAKNAFLFNMSHDIRTPMNSILGFTALAKKHIDDKAKAMEYLNKADASGNQLLKLINEILDMSRIEHGQVNLQMKPMDILEELKLSEGSFRDEMVKRGLRLTVYKKITHPYIICDHLRVQQIIYIILDNAMKYTKPGGKVMLKITETNEKEDDKTWYEIKVKDTGVGMSEEFQKNMFGFFEREKQTASSNSEGVGLGLSIVKGLVDLMGGRIEVKSAVDEGTEFLVYLPLQIYEGDEVKSDKVTVDTKEFCGKKVLLVEDNALNREIAKELLEEEKIVVTEAEDGSVALDILMHSKATDFDLILMDIQMPFMDGYLTTQAIRSMPNKKLANIPIIAMTANAFEEDRKKTLDAGMNDHIAKPIDLPKLFMAMKRVL